MTKAEIDAQYQQLVLKLEQEYFDFDPDAQKRILKAGKLLDEFNQKHGQLWKEHEAELIAAGYLQPMPVPPDWKAMWQAAATETAKLAILARILGVEGE